jgi:hypothetical protein
MGMRGMIGALGVMLGVVLTAPAAGLAADAEAAQGQLTEVGRQEILQTIEQTRLTDPELAAEMEQQLQLLEAGQLNLTAEGNAPSHAEGDGTAAPNQETTSATNLSGATLGATAEGGLRLEGGEELPPEALKELEELFSQGTGDPNSEVDRELREKAEEIFEKYGIEPPDFEGHEGDWEQNRDQWESMGHEQWGAEQWGSESAPMESSTEAPMREYESVMPEYEAPTQEYEAPTHEYEAPTYEAPTYEAPTYEAPTMDYQPPESDGGMMPQP